MTKKQITSKEYFKAIRLVHTAVLAGQVIFGIIGSYLGLNNMVEVADSEVETVLLIIVSIFVFTGTITIYFLFKKSISKTRRSNNIFDKTAGYRSSLITQFAIIEGQSFFAIVAFILAPNIVFLIYFFAMLLYFLTLRPSKEKIITELNLDSEDEKLIYDDDALISEFEQQ